MPCNYQVQMNYTMTKVKLLSIAVIGLLLINLGILAYLFLRPSQGTAPGRPGGKMKEPREIIIRELGLDDQQIEAYEILIQKHQDGIRAIDRQIRDAKNSLYISLGTDQPAQQDSLINRIGSLQMQVEALHYDHFAAIKELLKPAQMESFTKLSRELARLFGSPPAKAGPPPHE